jgi:hypothetical protein
VRSFFYRLTAQCHRKCNRRVRRPDPDSRPIVSPDRRDLLSVRRGLGWDCSVVAPLPLVRPSGRDSVALSYHSLEAILPTRLSNSQLHHLARLGAVHRLAELKAEIATIEQAFPKNARKVTAVRRRRHPGRPGWSPSQRQAAARRMQKYWAARKAKADAKK